MRYFYAMGREGILPKALGKTHPKHKSPYVASITQTVFALVLVLAWGIGSGFSFADASDTAYVRIYTMMAVQGVVWLLAIQAVCALAVLVWHRRHKHPDSWLVVVAVPDHRDRRPGVRDLPAVREHRHAGRHDRLRRPDRPDRAHRRGRSASATRSALKPTNRKKFDTIGRMIDEGRSTSPTT